MVEPGFCQTANTNDIQKYHTSTPFDDKNVTIRPKIKEKHVENKICCPNEGIINRMPENIGCCVVEKPKNDEVTGCSVSGVQVATSNNCSVPLENWTELAQQIGTRPTVDKHTISRYSPAEWRLHNQKLSEDANKAVQDAENVIFTAKSMDGPIYLSIDVNQMMNNTRIQDRAQTVFDMKVKLEKEIAKVTDEIQKIQKFIQRLINSNRAIESIKIIDRDMQNIRNMRLSSDLIHDAVTNEINKEEVLCVEIIDLHSHSIDVIKEQICELKDAKQRLEHDWSDKKNAYDIDTACLSLKNSSQTTQWKPACAHLPDGQSTPVDHKNFTKESLIFMQTALTRSMILRDNIKVMIQKSVKDLRAQSNNVEIALMKNIDNTFEAYRTLERFLVQCLKSSSQTETIVERINGAIRKLDAPMKCAQTRLDMRLERERVENCRDVPQFGLIDEMKIISESVTVLLSQAESGKKSIEALRKSREDIENELKVKQKTLWVDNERCRKMRSFYPSNSALLGYI